MVCGRCGSPPCEKVSRRLPKKKLLILSTIIGFNIEMLLPGSGCEDYVEILGGIDKALFRKIEDDCEAKKQIPKIGQQSGMYATFT